MFTKFSYKYFLHAPVLFKSLLRSGLAQCIGIKMVYKMICHYCALQLCHLVVGYIPLFRLSSLANKRSRLYSELSHMSDFSTNIT